MVSIRSTVLENNGPTKFRFGQGRSWKIIQVGGRGRTFFFFIFLVYQFNDRFVLALRWKCCRNINNIFPIIIHRVFFKHILNLKPSSSYFYQASSYYQALSFAPTCVIRYYSRITWISFSKWIWNKHRN